MLSCNSFEPFTYLILLTVYFLAPRGEAKCRKKTHPLNNSGTFTPRPAPWRPGVGRPRRLFTAGSKKAKRRVREVFQPLTDAKKWRGHDKLANMEEPVYRGRIAPSPTGYLHVGHARTFWQASERAKAAGGKLILRNEDIDGPRCKPEFLNAIIEDLQWFGFQWHEGPDIGGPFAPYTQNERRHLYRTALDRLKAGGFVYPCFCSRKDIAMAASAPHGPDDEMIYPGTCRPRSGTSSASIDSGTAFASVACDWDKRSESRITWRFRVPDGEPVSFVDGNFGEQLFVGGSHFGDFVVWRPDDHPAYQLAVVVDDAAMRITEVVRGADLLVSTARQILLFRALELSVPSFFHCELLTDENGVRLAKRHASLSLRALRESGQSPLMVHHRWIESGATSRI